jgi:hypothetical protein
LAGHEAVMSHADLVQGSYDNWDYTGLDQDVDNYGDWMNGCELGLLEDEYLDLGDAQYQCVNSEWRQVYNPFAPSTPSLKFVAFEDPCDWTKDDMKTMIVGADILAGAWAWGLSGIFGIVYPGAGHLSQGFITVTAAAAASRYQYVAIAWQRRQC